MGEAFEEQVQSLVFSDEAKKQHEMHIGREAQLLTGDGFEERVAVGVVEGVGFRGKKP